MSTTTRASQARNGEEQNLRQASFRGGAFLALRETLGIAVRLGGVLVVTRTIGATDYGIFAGVSAVVTVLATIAQLGAEVYLIRRKEEPQQADYDACFTFVAASSAVVTGISLVAAVLLGALLDDPAFIGPFVALAIVLPVNVLWAPAQAMIERGLAYGKMAILEVGGDVVLYGVAVPLALAGWGVWAPVAGYMAWQTFLLVASYRLAHYRPRLVWSTPVVRDLVRFGFGFSLQTWMQRAQELVNPLVIGPLLGAAAVGQVAVARRIVETLGFVLAATYRLSYVVFGRVQSEGARLLRGVEDVMALQLLALGASMSGFVLVAESVVPWLFGAEYADAVLVLPAFALAFHLTAATNVQSYALQVLGRTMPVAAAEGLRVTLFAAATAALVPVVGLAAYGWGALLSVVAYVIVHRALRRVGAFSYAKALPWVLAFAPVLFAPAVPWPWRGALVVLPLLGAAVPAGRTTLVEFVQLSRGAMLRAAR